jgi:hypothetical protein
MSEPQKLLSSSGGYRKTASFQTTTLIYDATVWFCEKSLDSRSRTVDPKKENGRVRRAPLSKVFDGWAGGS